MIRAVTPPVSLYYHLNDGEMNYPLTHISMLEVAGISNGKAPSFREKTGPRAY